MSIRLSFKNRNRNGSQRYQRRLSWSCFTNKSPRSSMLFLLGLHRLCHVLVYSAHDSNPRGCAVLKQSSKENFNTVSIFMATNFYVQDWTDPRILENPSFRSSLLLVSVISALLLHHISFFCIKCEEVLSSFDNPQTSVRA